MIIKQFFCENNESKNESSLIKDLYKKFLKEYDKNDFKDFKNLIVIKTLSKGDRVCVLTHLKKIVINPSQLFIGTEISDNVLEIKEILEGYLILILLHETEQFLRFLDENNKNMGASTQRSKEKERGKLFIKYLFGVESINHINDKQAKDILNLDNWKNHELIKSIFKDQQEENVDLDVNEYFIKKYPHSISFDSNRNTILKRVKSSNFIAVKK